VIRPTSNEKIYFAKSLPGLCARNVLLLPCQPESVGRQQRRRSTLDGVTVILVVWTIILLIVW
jgi:hypothetical protein